MILKYRRIPLADGETDLSFEGSLTPLQTFFEFPDPEVEYVSPDPEEFEQLLTLDQLHKTLLGQRHIVS